MSNTEFTNKVVLITGAASGIGKAIALAFAEQQATVVVADVDIEAGRDVASRCGGNSIFMPLDVTNEQQWINAIEQINILFKRLDVLVNNAGTGSYVSFEELLLTQWQAEVDLNLTGTFLGCKQALTLLKKSSGGSIINMSSVHGSKPHPLAIAYSATKAAVLSLTRTVAIHCGNAGYSIRCNAIQPGYTYTPLLNNAIAVAQDGAAMVTSLEQMHPIGRLADSEEIADAVLFLASKKAKFITGISLPVDGGFTAV